MSYLKNKKNRLKTKYSNILLKDFGIVMSDSPTQTIVICNGGLCNGITYEMVCETFYQFENVESVIMVPGKSYSFVKFKDEVSAMKAFNDVSGKIIWSNIKGPVHLDYVKDFNPTLLKQSKIFKNPPELILIDDFITEEEEEFILGLVGFNDDNEEGNSSQLKHRKVKHFGYEFKYSTNNVDLNEPIEKIPTELSFLWERLKKYSNEHNCNINFVPDQLTINCYEPGQGIPPHVDTHSAFEDGILSLSLQSCIVMEFKNESGTSYNVILKRRSLCIMLGESRYNWTHGITPRKSDLVPNDAGALTVQNREKRTSLTFRKTRNGKCFCKYPRLCDSAMEILNNPQNVSNMKSISLKKEAASELEGNYVHEVYNKIASHFSETRHKPWPNVVKFVNSFDVGSIVVDVGCGNGKYFTNQGTRFEVGCDSSDGLMKVCRERGFECFTCNCLKIPIRDNVADGCICIAVIHHLTTEERRRKAIEEMIRILKKNGRALIYVWAKNQEAGGEKSSYLKQNYKKNLKKDEKEECKLQVVSLSNSNEEIILPIHNNRTAFNHNDLLVPWKLKTKSDDSNDSNEAPVYLRFYHVYEENELKNLCLKMENVDVLDYYYDQGNWCIILQKK